MQGEMGNTRQVQDVPDAKRPQPPPAEARTRHCVDARAAFDRARHLHGIRRRRSANCNEEERLEQTVPTLLHRVGDEHSRNVWLLLDGPGGLEGPPTTGLSDVPCSPEAFLTSTDYAHNPLFTDLDQRQMSNPKGSGATKSLGEVAQFCAVSPNRFTFALGITQGRAKDEHVLRLMLLQHPGLATQPFLPEPAVRVVQTDLPALLGAKWATTRVQNELVSTNRPLVLEYQGFNVQPILWQYDGNGARQHMEARTLVNVKRTRACTTCPSRTAHESTRQADGAGSGQSSRHGGRKYARACDDG